MAVPVRNRLRLEFAERDEQLEGQFRSQMAQLSAKGMLASGAAVRGLVEAAEAEFKLRAGLAYRHFLRHFAVLRLRPEGVGRSATAFIVGILSEQAPHLLTMVSRQAPFRSGASFDIARFATRFQTLLDREQIRLESEFDLWEMEMCSREDGRSASASVSITGDNNIVQAGIVGSAASIIVDPQSREAVRAALASVRSALVNSRDVDLTTRDELAGVITDCEREIAAERPNRSRLLGGLQAISAAVQTTGSLGPAWETLKAALQALGLHV